MLPAVFIAVLVVIVGLTLVVQFVVRPRLGRRGKLAVDASTGDLGAEWELRRQLSYDVLSRVTPGVYQPGSYLMKGKAGKHLAMLSRTFVVRADPAAVAAVLAPVMQGAAFAPAGNGPGEAAAWEATGSMFGRYPRVAVSGSRVLPGATEFGVTHYQWSLKFPQGGPLVERVWGPALGALRAASMVASEQVRGFAPDSTVRTDVGDRNGIWHADGLVAEAAPDMQKR